MQVELEYDIEEVEKNYDSLKSVVEHIILFGDDNEEIRNELDKLMNHFREIKRGPQILKKALTEIEAKNQQFIIENKIMARFTFTREDFDTAVPYAYLFAFVTDRFQHELEVNKMAAEAKAVGYVGFKKAYSQYIKSMRKVNLSNRIDIMNPSDFPEFKDGTKLELECGQWCCDAEGVKIIDGSGATQVACCQPILPVERLVNIDTREERLKLAFYKLNHWEETIVSKEITSVASKITSLAPKGVAVTSENAKFLVRYLCDVENMNLNRIPEHSSVSRLGYVTGGFSPYVDNLIFDGEASYAKIFKAIHEPKGTLEEWIKVASKCRQESLIARIMLAASFASVLVSKVGCLPFFVHVWTGESSTGKTVGLMLAASVWGNPEPGEYVQSFNGTQVGQERMAAFLNNLPMLIDELQLSKDLHGNSKFDVYQLTEGFGRTRGNKAGGIDATPTWKCCFISTGETPIVNDGSGAGAHNRVLDIECKKDEKVIYDGRTTAGSVRTNYGHAGRKFVEEIEKDENYEKLKMMYDAYYETLLKSDASDKQVFVAALLLATDALISELFFDSEPMEIEDISQYMKTKKEISIGDRGYSYICDWYSLNSRNFLNPDESGDQPVKVYGKKISQFQVAINHSVFKSALAEGGFNAKTVLSFLKSNGLIEVREKGFTKAKKILGVPTECVFLNLPKYTDESEKDVQLL